MIKRLSKLIAIVFMFALCLSSTAVAVDARSSEYIRTYSATASGGSGSITVDFSITAKSSMNKLGASKIEIKNSSGTTVKTFYSSTTTGMVTSNAITFTSSVTYNGTRGVKYYAVVYFIASNTNGSDTDSWTTNTV